MNLIIQPAKNLHLNELSKLLHANQLPMEDILDQKIQFFVALINNVIIGIEKYQHFGLKRSLAVNQRV